MQFADIAVNLGDPMFRGNYHGKQRHTSDLEAVVERARSAGVTRMLLTGTSLEESRIVLDYAKKFGFHSTAGCHPTSTTEIDQHAGGEEAYFAELEKLISEDRGEGGSKSIIAIGEIGLDYDRLKFAPKETQLKHLPRLLRLSQKFDLPMFMHDRHPEAHADLVRTLKEVEFGPQWPGGVAHSFTGTTSEMKELVDLGLYIGINGCSLKTAENLEVVKAIPLDKLMLETDAPWCSVTTTHASHAFIPKGLVVVDKVKPEKFVEGKGTKGRNEPAEVVTIANIVANVKGVPVEEVAKAAWENTQKLFYRDHPAN